MKLNMECRLYQNSRAWTYDIESYGNFFCVYFRNVKTKSERAFVIHGDVNMLHPLVMFLRSPAVDTLVGFNSLHYDDKMLSYILYAFRALSEYDADELTAILWKASTFIIEGDRGFRVPMSNLWKSVDLFKMLGFKRSNVSLKRAAVYLGLKTIQDLPYPPGMMLNKEQAHEVLKYNRVDIDATEAILFHVENEVLVREFMEDKFHTSFYNADSTYLGKIIFIEKFNQKVSDEYKIDMSDLRRWRTPRKEIKLSTVISDKVKFETPVFRKVLDDLSDVTVEVIDNKMRVWDEEKQKHVEFKYEFKLNDIKYTIGLGGIHDKQKKWLVDVKDDEFLCEADASAYYPSWMVSEKIVPEHFKAVAKQFVETIQELIDERLFFKLAEVKTKFTELSDYVLKIAINSLFGLLGSKYFAFYDLKCVLQTTINGQLGLLRLIEMANIRNIKAYSANTDGVLFWTKRKWKPAIDYIVPVWEKEFDIGMDVEEYSRIVQNHVNSYIWYTPKGKVKYKGEFTPLKKKRFDQSVNQTIVVDALNTYFQDGTPVDTTISNCKDIMKFTITKRLGTEKSSQLPYKLWTVDDEGYPVEQQQKTTRFYCSTVGHKLKRVGVNQSAYIIKDQNVKVFNTYEEKPFEEHHVDISYYQTAANKIVNGFTTLTL